MEKTVMRVKADHEPHARGSIMRPHQLTHWVFRQRQDAEFRNQIKNDLVKSSFNHRKNMIDANGGERMSSNKLIGEKPLSFFAAQHLLDLCDLQSGQRPTFAGKVLL